MKYFRNLETGECLTPTKGGGLANTGTGITTYDSDIINKIVGGVDEGCVWVEEEIKPNIFDYVPNCVSPEGDILDDVIEREN